MSDHLYSLLLLAAILCGLLLTGFILRAQAEWDQAATDRAAAASAIAHRAALEAQLGAAHADVERLTREAAASCAAPELITCVAGGAVWRAADGRCDIEDAP